MLSRDAGYTQIRVAIPVPGGQHCPEQEQGLGECTMLFSNFHDKQENGKKDVGEV